MTPVDIIRDARAEGVRLELSPAGTIKATGEAAAVNRWLPAIREHKLAIIAALKADAGRTASATWWLLRYPDGKLLEVAFCPPVRRDEALALYPGAVEAEAFEPEIRTPSEPLSFEDEAAIRRWLDKIGEDDAALVAEVIERCRCDAEARDDFLALATPATEGEHRGVARAAGPSRGNGKRVRSGAIQR
jgi:hypothetical protein